MTERELLEEFGGRWPGERTRRAVEDRPLLRSRVVAAAIQDSIDAERAKPLSAWQSDRLDEAEALLRSIREDGLPEVPMEGPLPEGAERTLARLQAAHRLLKQALLGPLAGRLLGRPGLRLALALGLLAAAVALFLLG